MKDPGGCDFAMIPTPTPTAPGRVPPHSVEAEEQLLSACLLDKIA
jgi:hypothetical protein